MPQKDIAKKRELARAYAQADRRAFCLLKRWDYDSDLKRLLKSTADRLSAQHSTSDLDRLCRLGCEYDEILWLLAGAWKSVLTTEELFGRKPKALSQSLALLGNCATTLDSLSASRGGALLNFTLLPAMQDLAKDLRTVADYAEAAKDAFQKRGEWFLRVARARLIDHVTYKSRDSDSHDEEVSRMIAVVTGKRYKVTAHRAFQGKYAWLLADKSSDPHGYRALDPYTVRSSAERDETTKALVEGLKDPGIRQATENEIRLYMRLLCESTEPHPCKRKTPRNDFSASCWRLFP